MTSLGSSEAQSRESNCFVNLDQAIFLISVSPELGLINNNAWLSYVYKHPRLILVCRNVVTSTGNGYRTHQACLQKHMPHRQAVGLGNWIPRVSIVAPIHDQNRMDEAISSLGILHGAISPSASTTALPARRLFAASLVLLTSNLHFCPLYLRVVWLSSCLGN